MAKIEWRGAWSGATAYAVHDAVQSSGTSYVCIQAHTNHQPPNAAYWDLLAAKGTDGTGIGDMLAANNLSEVTPAAARTNLGLGTAATLDVGATAGKVVQLDGSARLPPVDGSLLTGISTADDTARDQIAALFLGAVVTDSVATGAMIYGTADAFATDTIGGTSTGASYSSGGKYYVAYPGGLFDTYGSANAANSWDLWNATNASVAQVLAIASATTITQVKFWAQKIGSPMGNAVAKIYAATGSVGSTAIPSGAALATSDAVSVSGVSGTLGWVTFTFSTSYAAAAGNYAIAVEYTAGSSGNALRVYCDASAPTHGGNEASFGPSWTAYGGEDLIFKLYNAASTTMTRLPAAATAAPTDARLCVLYKDDSGTAVLNADVTFEVSRDGGTTWTAVTMVDAGDYDGTYRKLIGHVDISAQPSGTSMKWRIATLNNKAQRVRGVAMMWGG